MSLRNESSTNQAVDPDIDILKEKLKPVLKNLINGEIESSIWEIVKDHPHISAKFLPYQGQSSIYIIDKNRFNRKDMLSELPIPPKQLWEGYAETKDEFLQTGKVHMTTMFEILEKDEFKIRDGSRILEFGCAAARMLRWFFEKARTCEIWGTDISAEHIIWCQQNLSPPFHFFTNTTEPHLPFESNYFDFIFAGSVFTHISELYDFWYLELKRVLKPHGRLYITIHDRHSIDLFINRFPDFFLSEKLIEINKSSQILEKDFDMFCVAMFSSVDMRNPKGAMVFYDINYLTNKLSNLFKVRSVWPEAYGCQTAVLLEKL